MSVSFAVASGGGGVSSPTVITDVNGNAAAKFITGKTVGLNSATATVTGLAAVTFSTASVAGPAARIVKIGLDPASVPAGASFSDSIRVLITDGLGNPTSSVSVAFAATSGGGSVTPATVITDASGRAAAKFMTGTLVSANAATAAVTGLSLVTFSTLSVAGPAASILMIGTYPTIVVAGSSFSDSIRVQVTDALGNPKSGTGVGFGVISGGGSLSSAGGVIILSAITDANGKAAAKFITGTTAGINTGVIVKTGLPAITFSITTRPVLIWSIVPSNTSSTGHLFGVWGSSPSDVWAVGDDMQHYNGTSWSGVASGTTQQLRGVWGSSATDVWVVGGGGTFLHFDGTNWSSVSTGTTPPIMFGVWGMSASDVWAVGYSGTIVHFDGTNWSSVTSGTSSGLYAVWGTSSSDVWAVGAYTILHFNGTSWMDVSGGTPLVLFSVWGSSVSDVWAVGSAGTILHYNGTSWLSVSSGTIQDLFSVWGTSASDVWATGRNGTILHYDGSSWSSISSGTIESLLGVWGTSSSDAWAVGSHETFLHWSR